MATIQLSLPESMSIQPTVVTGLIILENVRYRITLRWSPRDDRDGMWRMDISNAAGVLQVAGIPLVTSSNVLKPFQYKSRSVPPGALRVTCDPGANGVPCDPGLYDFGKRARLEYIESADLAT